MSYRVPHRAITWLAGVIVVGLTASGAGAAALSPAAYKPLPKGATLDYGSWQCRADEGADFKQVCRDSSGNAVAFYGTFVPVGELPASGYATGLTELWCGGLGLGGAAPVPMEGVVLSDKDRAAIRSLWPLEVGKEIAFRKNFQPVDGKAKAKITVMEKKTVTVLGHSREVFVLEGKTTKFRCPANQKRSFTETWLYDAGLGAVVRYELKWANSPVPDQDVAYTLMKTSLLKAIKPKPKLIARAPAAPAAAQVARRSARAVVSDTTGPVIAMPASLKTTSTMVEISGTVKDELSQVVELTVGKRRVPIAGDGTFKIRRAVRIGTSTLVIAALDEWGNRTEMRIAVKREVAAAKSGPAGASGKNAALARFSDIYFGDYYALVIGNNDYADFPNLKMAIADVDAISTMLREDYGFKVEVLTNATRGGSSARLPGCGRS
jgi:hypothetical protein